LTAGFTTSVGALMFLMNPDLFACEKKTPLDTGCPQPPTVSICRGTTPVAPKTCKDYMEQSVANGAFGCQDNGDNKTQCVDALNQQGNLIKCYDEYNCQPFGATCQINGATKNTKYRLKKIEKPCKGS
jgi:hypothetical protein